jgi:DNA-binding transcriptional LysR family regulator
MLDALTLDQLRVLVAVSETGSFSGAARKLMRVQSAVSQSIHTLEDTLRLQLFDRSGKLPKATEAGRIIIEDARRLLKGAEVLRARAENIVGGLEPELTIAINPLLPAAPAIEALRALREEFPGLPVMLLTEGIGAPERHLRDGTVRLAIYPYSETGTSDLDAEFLIDIDMIPVVAADHPLAQLPGPLSREDLADHVQLVLTDGTPIEAWSRGVVSHRLWRFADMITRRSFLLEGFGWCHMPLPSVAPYIAEGRLKRLMLKDQHFGSIALHVVHEHGRPPGTAGRWLISRLHQALAQFAKAG